MLVRFGHIAMSVIVKKCFAIENDDGNFFSKKLADRAAAVRKLKRLAQGKPSQLHAAA